MVNLNKSKKGWTKFTTKSSCNEKMLKNLQLLRLHLHINLNVTNGWLIFSAQLVLKCLHFWAKLLSSFPALTLDFTKVIKGGFYWSFDLNVAFFYLSRFLDFLLLIWLAILGSYPTYHQENFGKDISKKRHSLHMNKVMLFYIWKQLKYHHSWTWYFNSFNVNALFQHSLKISEN